MGLLYLKINCWIADNRKSNMNNFYQMFGSGVLKVNKVLAPKVIVTWKSIRANSEMWIERLIWLIAQVKNIEFNEKNIALKFKNPLWDSNCGPRYSLSGRQPTELWRQNSFRHQNCILISSRNIRPSKDMQVLRFGYLASWQIAGNWKFCFVHSSINIHIYIFRETEKVNMMK